MNLVPFSFIRVMRYSTRYCRVQRVYICITRLFGMRPIIFIGAILRWNLIRFDIWLCASYHRSYHQCVTWYHEQAFRPVPENWANILTWIVSLPLTFDWLKWGWAAFAHTSNYWYLSGWAGFMCMLVYTEWGS